MKRILIIIAVNLVILGLIFGVYNSAKKGETVVTSDTRKPDDVQEEDFETTDVTVILEVGMDLNKLMAEVKSAVSYFPAAMIKSFNEEGWKVMVVSEIDFTDSPYDGTSPDYPEQTVGLTNFRTSIIQIKNIGVDGFVKLKLLHEMSHYFDKFLGYPSPGDEVFKGLYQKHQKDYVEYEYKDVTKTEENRQDIEYAVSDHMEFFACVCKDYLYNREYLQETYPDLYEYFDRIVTEANMIKVVPVEIETEGTSN